MDKITTLYFHNSRPKKCGQKQRSVVTPVQFGHTFSVGKNIMNKFNKKRNGKD